MAPARTWRLGMRAAWHWRDNSKVSSSPKTSEPNQMRGIALVRLVRFGSVRCVPKGTPSNRTEPTNPDDDGDAPGVSALTPDAPGRKEEVVAPDEEERVGLVRRTNRRSEPITEPEPDEEAAGVDI